MPIHIILGKPGSGKSLLATSYSFTQCIETERNITTNLPLKPGNLNEYLQKKHPEQDCRLVQRLRMLSDVEIRYFWKFRSPEDVGPPELYELENCTDETKRAVLLKKLDAWAMSPTISGNGKGVAFFIDEAHIAFNARDWSTIGKGALHYLSQHRKLGDIVFVITQAPGNLDKQFRSVAEDFTVVRNEYTAKYGPFRGRGRFVRRTYLSEPSGNAEPFEKVAFTLDKEGIASCYDTAKGIGVHGSKADIGRRAKGISIWWAFAGAFALAGLVGLVPWLLGKGAQRVMTGKAKTAVEAAGVASLPGQFAPPSPAAPAVAGYAPESAPFPTGYVVARGKVTVQMSDGTTRIELWESEDGVRGEVTSVDRNAVYLERVKAFMRPRPRDLAAVTSAGPVVTPAPADSPLP